MHASPALQQKIAKTRANAPMDLPLVRNCANVVLAYVSGNGMNVAITSLKETHGPNWSLTTALQLLSGRRGRFAIECAPLPERQTLFLAHLVAKSVCNQGRLGAVNMPTETEMDELRRLSAQQHQVGPENPSDNALNHPAQKQKIPQTHASRGILF